MALLYRCFGCSLKAGSMISAVIFMLEILANILIYTWGLLGIISDKFHIEQEGNEDVFLGMQIVVYALLGLFVVILFITIILFCGAAKENATALVIWIVTISFYMLLESAGAVYLCVTYASELQGLENYPFAIVNLAWWIVRTLINFAILVCVCSQYVVIVEKEKKAGHRFYTDDSNRLV